MAAKPDKITIEHGKFACYVRLHRGSEWETWRKGPYNRERAFASAETAIERARKTFPGVPIETNANGRRRSRANHSRNREGLSFEQWAREAGLGARSVPGAHGAWIKGKNPVSWSKTYGVTMVANPAGGMDAAEFCEALASMADLNGKTLRCHHESRLAGERHDTIYINFYNLTAERVKEKRGGGAEAENNRVHLRVEGFARQLGEPPPTGKVKVETMISLYEATTPKLRAKTGTPEAIAKYVADHVSKLALTPSNLTHANPRRRTSKKKRTSRRRR